MDVECVLCKENMRARLLFSSDGEIALELKCAKCGKETNLVTSGAGLVRQATLNDIAASMGEKPRRKKKSTQGAEKSVPGQPQKVGWVN
jgi:phage FluMu protein Com